MQNLIIIGAGEAGRIIARDLIKRKNAKVVGFLDDNPLLQTKTFFGVPVLGKLSFLSNISKKYVISEVIVAIPSATGEILTPIIKEILSVNLPYRITPGFYNFKTNDVDIQYPLRNIDISDLLMRNIVDLPLKLISDYLKNKTVLITGAGGSIGSEITRTLCMFSPKEIILLGRGEGSVFSIQNELKARFHGIMTKSVIANCTDRGSIFEHFSRLKPQIVFHTAAHKHVPFMEQDPKEAFKNNVLGSINVFNAAVHAGVERVIILSTDKAVYPKSVMGISKRVVECLIQNDFEDKGTVFSGVRFGNVLGSRGSVVEVFQRQIERGGPLTITSPKAKRYFMTIPEASQLVIMTGALAKQGHMYILDMGKQISILSLAKELIKLNRLRPSKDIKMLFTGLRPGEKLKESLLLKTGLKKTIHNKIWEEPPLKKKNLLMPLINEIIPLIDSLDGKDVLKFMKQLIS